MDIVNLDSVADYNNLYGFATRHPLVTVVDLKKSDRVLNYARVTYGLYALFLKN